MHTEVAVLALFAVAVGVALVARRVKVPYTVALVLAGLALGTTHLLQPPRLTQKLLYGLFLPGLLFEAAFHLDLRKYWRNKLSIHILALPGVLAALGLTAAVLVPTVRAFHIGEGFGLAHGLVLGAVLSATDPIAVVALFKSLGAPRRLAVIVEGESLLNDGTAAVLFTILVGVVTGHPLSVGAAALDFARVVGLGAAVGLALGYGVSKVMQQIDDAKLEITLTTIAAYGSFLVAEHLHLSGVIATVFAGMTCGTYGARDAMSPSSRLSVQAFWEYVAFALNSLVFLLIGFTVHLGELLAAWRGVLAAFFAITVARAGVVFGASLVLRRTSERAPWSWSAVLAWGGLRGALSMVLVLGLPETVPHLQLLTNMTFGAVLLSILLQGLTVAPLLRRLGLTGSQDERRDYEHGRAALHAARAGLAALDELGREGSYHAEVLAELRERYEKRAAAADARVGALHLERTHLREEEQRNAERHLALVEKDALRHAAAQGSLSASVVEELERALDEQLLALAEHEHEHEHEHDGDEE